jgi:Tfp pilus assembly protein PilF
MKRKKKPTPAANQSTRRSKRIYVLTALFVLLFCLFLFLGGFAGVARSMAKNALVLNDVRRASPWLDIATKLAPDAPELHYLIARSARLKLDYNNMAKHLRLANLGGYDREAIDKEQCLAFACLGELNPANEAKVKKWIAQCGPDVADFVDAYANGLAATSKFEEATRVLEDYEALFPQDPLVNYRFGLMNEHTKSNELAEKEYAAAMLKDPSHAKSAWRYARLLCGRNRPEEALKTLTLFQKGPQEIAVKTFMASCYFQMGDLETSRDLFKKIVVIDKQKVLESYLSLDEWPERNLAASELGVIESNLGIFDEAKKHLEIALEDNPRDFIARSAYALVLRRLGDKDRADLELARVTAERTEFDKLTVLRDQVKQNPDDAKSKFAMGEILFKYESERFGLFWIRSALTSDPSCKEAHAFLASYYEQKMSENDALRGKANYHRDRLSQLNKLEPKNPD